MHDEDDLIHDTDDSSENEHVTEIESHIVNGSKIMYKRTNSLLPILKLEWKIRNLKCS